jgi:hypothetical protein
MTQKAQSPCCSDILRSAEEASVIAVTSIIELGNYSLAAIFSASVVALLIASEIGHLCGLRAAGEANVTTLEAAILGLLALMISFTFAMALTRHPQKAE